MEMLFAAFEKHQYYNLKDLVRITNQPVVSFIYNQHFLIMNLKHFRYSALDIDYLINY